MFVNVDIESAIISLTELNNAVQFIDAHAEDITDTDTAVGLLHIIAGLLDSKTKALRDSYYTERKDA